MPPNYNDFLYCARCEQFVSKDSRIRIDIRGRQICECGTNLRQGPRRTNSKEKTKIVTNCKCGHSKRAHCSYDGKPPFVCLGYWFKYIDDKDCKCEQWVKPWPAAPVVITTAFFIQTSAVNQSPALKKKTAVVKSIYHVAHTVFWPLEL